MNQIETKEVFRGSRSKAVLVAVCSGVFVVAGLLCFRAVGSHLFSYGFTALGCFGFVCASDFFRQKVLLTPVGIKKTLSGFSAGWEEVESWAVEDVRGTSDEDSFTQAAVCLQVRGSRQVAKIYDSDVVYPGFGHLVAAMRHYALKKELPNKSPQTTRAFGPRV